MAEQNTPTTPSCRQHVLSNNSTQHCRPNKVVKISDCITLVDVAMERVRQNWRKKKTDKREKRWLIPPDVAQLVIQALTISRAHLIDYREHATEEPHTRDKIDLAAVTTTEQLMNGLGTNRSIRGELLMEPIDTIGKINTIFALLWNSKDEETGEYRINAEEMGWATMLLEDQVEELAIRVEGYQDHCRDLILEFESRLESHYLVPRESLQERRQ